MALNGGYKTVSITVLIATCLVLADGDVIRGTYHAWWVILPLPVSAVQGMINREFITNLPINKYNLARDYLYIIRNYKFTHNTLCIPTTSAFRSVRHRHIEFEIL